MLSWCLNVPTNCLWTPCPGVQLYQCDKTGLYHKFLFLSSPDCDLVMFKSTNKIPSHFLLVYLTLTQINALAHGSLLSPRSPPAWLSHLSTMAPIWPPPWHAVPLSSKNHDYNKSFNFIWLSKYNFCSCVEMILKDLTKETYSIILNTLFLSDGYFVLF